MSTNMRKWLINGLILLVFCVALYAVTVRPSGLPEACQLGNEAMEAGDYDGAIDHYLGCAGDENLPEEMRGRLFYILGNAYVAKGQYAQAIEDFSEAIRLDPSLGWAFNNRCWTYGLLGRAEDALPDCNRALSLLPDQPEVLDSRALIYWQLGETAKARADLDRARTVDSSLPSPEQRFQEFEEMF